ncbi:MAG: hypothetical protein K6347_02670 [Campylobacterales bacterium]
MSHYVVAAMFGAIACWVVLFPVVIHRLGTLLSALTIQTITRVSGAIIALIVIVAIMRLW